MVDYFLRKRTMFRPFFLFIGARYTNFKRPDHFITFISIISMIGIALGVMVFITVLSVMNGFTKDEANAGRIFDLADVIADPESKFFPSATHSTKDSGSSDGVSGSAHPDLLLNSLATSDPKDFR